MNIYMNNNDNDDSNNDDNVIYIYIYIYIYTPPRGLPGARHGAGDLPRDRGAHGALPCQPAGRERCVQIMLFRL